MLAKTNPPGVHQTSLYECADGWVHAATMNGLTAKSTLQEVAGLEAPDPAAIWSATPQQRREADERIRRALKERRRDEIVAKMNESNLGAEAVIPMREAYAHPQLVANGMVVQVDDPDLGPTTQIGVPVSLSRTPGGITGPRPLPGQHDDEVLSEGGNGLGAPERKVGAAGRGEPRGELQPRPRGRRRTRPRPVPRGSVRPDDPVGSRRRGDQGRARHGRRHAARCSAVRGLPERQEIDRSRPAHVPRGWRFSTSSSSVPTSCTTT